MAQYGLEIETTTHIKGMQVSDSQLDTGGGKIGLITYTNNAYQVDETIVVDSNNLAFEETADIDIIAPAGKFFDVVIVKSSNAYEVNHIKRIITSKEIPDGAVRIDGTGMSRVVKKLFYELKSEEMS